MSVETDWERAELWRAKANTQAARIHTLEGMLYANDKKWASAISQIADLEEDLRIALRDLHEADEELRRRNEEASP